MPLRSRSMIVTIERIEVDKTGMYLGPICYWVRATVRDCADALSLEEFAADPNVWDIILGAAEVAMADSRRTVD